MGNTTGSTSSSGSKGTSGKGSGISVGVLGNLRLPGKTRKKPKYRTAEDLCKQILFEYPFLKSVFSGGNVTAGCGGLGSVVVADHYASPDDAIVWVSDGFERLTMFSREDVLGTNCRFLQGPDTSPEAISSISKAIKAGESIQLEVLNYRKDGTAFWNNLRLLPVHGPGKVAGIVYNVVAFQEDVGTLADISSKGNIYDWRPRDVDVWLRRHKYGHYAKLFLAQNVTGEFLAQLTKKQMRELVSAANKDAFMASIISADADALYSLVRSHKKTSRPKLVISPSSSSSMLSSGEGSEDGEQEKSETEMDKRTKEDWQHFPGADSHSSSGDSSDGSRPGEKDWKLELASNPLFQAKSEDSLGSPHKDDGTVAIKYVFEEREAVVLLVPKWVSFAEFKKRIAYECGAPGWHFDMTWRVRFNDPPTTKETTGQLERSPSSSTAQRISSGENLSRATPRAPPANEKKIVMVSTEGEWKKLLAQAKGTVLLYCSKPVVLSKAHEEIEGQPGIP